MIQTTHTITDGYGRELFVEAKPGQGIVDLFGPTRFEAALSLTLAEVEELKLILDLAISDARDSTARPPRQVCCQLLICAEVEGVVDGDRVFITGADYFDDDSLPPLELDLWSGGSGFLEVLNPETLGEFYPVTTTTSQSSLFGDFFD